MTKCANDTCPTDAVEGSTWCMDHMPLSEHEERLARMLEQMEAHKASLMDRLDLKRDTEEQMHLARHKQDYEKVAPDEWEKIQGKLAARAEQAEIQGELKEMAFADYVKDPSCPHVEIFLEEKYVNIILDNRSGRAIYCLSMNGVHWPVKPNALNKIPYPFAADYRSKIAMWAHLKKMEDALSVGNYDRPPDRSDFKSQPEYEALLQRARRGEL